MQITATAKYIRISPQKVRLVVDQIQKMTPPHALDVLDHVTKSSAKPLKKVIASAVANAKNNFGLDEQTLKFKSLLVGIGPVSKRYQPVARGRAHSILKRTSHITVILEGEKTKEVAKVSDESKMEGGNQKSTNGKRQTTKENKSS